MLSFCTIQIQLILIQIVTGSLILHMHQLLLSVVVANFGPCHVQHLPQISVILRRKLFAWILNSRCFGSTSPGEQNALRNKQRGQQVDSINTSKLIYPLKRWEFHVLCSLAMLWSQSIQGKKELERAKFMPESSLAVDCTNSFVLVLGMLPDTFELTNLNIASKSQCLQYHPNISLVSKGRGHMDKFRTTSL